MSQVCLYFQLHQPYRLSEQDFLNLGKKSAYFADQDNREIFQKVSHKSYRPMLSLLWELTQQFPDFSFALSCSGVFLEQATTYDPEIIQLLKKLVATDQVELLTETYYHSLAALFSPAEFRRQVREHQNLVWKLFKVKPKVFRNTELIYSNQVAEQVADLGFWGMLTEAVPRYLHGRPKTQLYRSLDDPGLPLLLKHAELSDDIAFRFSDKNWPHHPLSAETFLDWVNVYGENEVVNLFMDFETFGEHQWASTGIFQFFSAWVEKFLAQPWNSFKKPSQLVAPARRKLASLPVYDVPEPISWADVDRDLTAWLENAFQQDCLRIIYDLESAVLAAKNPRILADWRKLQTSDHFYYMCTKWAADGDVHAYFSPYDSPHEAYRRYSLVLADLQERLL